ncbi:phage tail tape measure protein [Ancylobacter oerskovii]|uniref:Phage tail tape measure protein n=1 Tax=Ancylobacter oerskovii TaxID=459519 RepID=A0ABW4Z4A5_9HYPH|nr:phage tail tape measure protein [Ancylobacter oerskovii]MBS7545723.1 phage tail tape measure protein [Ancylobacter oerskovii]
MAGTKEAALRLQLIDGVSAPAKAVSGVLGRLDKTLKGFAARRDAVNQRVDQMRGRMIDATASAWALQRALSAPIQSAMAFESAMADVTKVVDFGGNAGIAAFKKDLLDLSARLPVAVTGLAQIAAAAGQAGIAGEELAKFTEGAAKIGVAFDISAGAAGDAMAKLRTGLGYSTDQVFRLADAMNELSNRQASSASDILDFETRVGAQAKMFGFAAEQAAAFGSAMISAGAAPEVAATSFNNMGRALTKGAAATKSQREAYKALGLEAKAVAKAMQKDAVGTTLNVMERIAKLPAERRASLVSQLFGDEARALGPLLTNLNLIRESLGIVGDEATYAGSATREYENRSKTTANAVQLFQNRVERLSISLGNALLPAMTSIMDTLAPMLDRLTELTSQYPKVTTAIVATTAGLVAFRIAAIGAAFATGMLRAGALTAAIVGMRGLSAAAAVTVAALAPFRAALMATSRAWAAFSIAARIGGIGTALAAVGTSALALLNPLKLAAGAVRVLGTALRVAFIGSGVGAIIAGIGAAGVLIHQNWAGISEMFSSFGKSFMAALGPAKPIVEGFATAVATIWEKITGILGPIDESGAKWRSWGETLGALAGGGVASLIAGLEKVAGWLRSLMELAGTAAKAISNVFSSGGSPNSGFSPPAGGYKPDPGWNGQPGLGAAPKVDGTRADGGPVEAGKSYLVGERGREIFRPRTDGDIIPNHRLSGNAGSPGRPGADGRDGAPGRDGQDRRGHGGGPMINMPVTINLKGGATNSDAQMLADALERRLNRAVQIAFGGANYGDK